jgi:hypothetical protein
MSETILIALIACTVGLFNDANKPKQYSLEFSKGKSENILIETNGKYACPKYCGTEHVHTALMCEGDCSHNHDSYQLHTSLSPNKKISLNGEIVLAMQKVQTSKKKNVRASQEVASK